MHPSLLDVSHVSDRDILVRRRSPPRAVAAVVPTREVEVEVFMPQEDAPRALVEVGKVTAKRNAAAAAEK